jgi:predicted signal transduction protein with EAL and GGDEF domain
LDDFGAGFASFYYLKNFSFDYLTIDGEFIRGLSANPIDGLVVQAIVGIARGMGKKPLLSLSEMRIRPACSARAALIMPKGIMWACRGRRRNLAPRHEAAQAALCAIQGLYFRCGSH